MITNQLLSFSVTGTGTEEFTIRGGIYLATLAADSWGTVTLNVLAADDTTYVPFQTWDANAAATLTLVAGSYQFSYNTVDTATLGLVQQPPSPNWRLQSLTQPLPISSSGGITSVSPLSGDTELELTGGSVVVDTPNVSGNTGSINIATGDSGSGNSGSITLAIGDADGTRGTITLDSLSFLAPSGFGVTCSNGNGVALIASDTNADNGDGADVELTSGNGAGLGNGGNVTVTLGNGTAKGNFILANLPTSSSGLPSGAVWNNSGTLKIV